MSHRLSIRCAVLVATLAVVGSSGSVLASPNRWATLIRSERFAERCNVSVHRWAQAARKSRLVSVARWTHVRFHGRRRPARPVGKLPNLGRGSQTKSPAPAAPGSETVVAPLPTQATLNAEGPAKQTGFDGLTRTTGPSTNVEPPDPWVAVGPDHVVQVVNLQMRITDRQGGHAIDVPLPDFSPPADGGRYVRFRRPHHLRQSPWPLAGDRGELGLRYLNGR